MTILQTTYKDNYFIDDEYKRELELLEEEDEYYYRVYAKGEWASIKVVGRVYKKFTDNNVIPASQFVYNEGLPLVVCVDFNVDPMKWAFIQNSRGIDYVFDEISQNDTITEDMAKATLEKFGKRDYIFYGDYSGTFRSTRSKTTDYEIIKQIIPGVDINTRPNPPIISRVNALNWRLCNDKGLIRMFVTDNCKHTIRDFNRVQWREGKREIEKSNDINKKDLTHISDAIGYYAEYEYSLKGKRVSKQWNT